MEPIRVLIVDDHAVFREGLSLLLSSRADRVQVVGEAADGEEAVRKVEALSPDVVLMDLRMPGADGFAAIEHLRAEQPRVAILVLTMHNDTQFIVELLAKGVQGWIPKQAGGDEVLAGIEAVAAGHVYLHSSVAGEVIEEYRRHPAGFAAQGTNPLTPREVQVLRLVAEGRRNREIAEELGVSVKTVETHRARIMEKLQVHDRVDLVRYAIRQGLVSV